MHWRLATVLVATAIIAAACAGETDDGGQSPTATPTEAAEPATTATETTDTTAAATPPTSAEAPTTGATAAPADAETTSTPPEPAPEPAATPAPTPDDGAEAHPSDAYFALDRVLDISIEIAAEDWDTLRHQTRTFEDLIAEIEEYGLSRPFAGIYTWFPGTVTVDGETHTDVGVRKKGFIGSQSDTKPALKLRFDKYTDGQSLGGVMERMTLNNSIQDPSMVNTCLSYRVFSAAGSPAPRCNFATVSVNGKDLGLYVHVEELKAPFLARHFDSTEGNLYEGTVSDFTPTYRGTIEKKTNEDAADWSDIDAVVAALQDPSDAGLEALGEIVDLDRFLSFWATEVLVGHWDGYAGDRNNYQFYREPDGRFVFIPWGPDDTFHLKDDPNPFDNISKPPPSVLALTAIPNRLYNDPDWRVEYVARLKEILDTIWDEAELLAAVDEMAAIVQRHALPEDREAAADDTERVRKFILKRRGEILADLTPEPPDWPDPAGSVPLPAASPSGTLEVAFQTTWGTNLIATPPGEGTVLSLVLDESPESLDGMVATAGYSTPAEEVLLPDVAETASIVVVKVEADGSLNGMVLAVALDELAAGATLVIGADAIAGGIFSIPAGAAAPDMFTSFSEGILELSGAGTVPGATVAGSFSGTFADAPPPAPGDGAGGAGADPGTAASEVGLVINEVAAKGDPLDWFELHNTLPDPVALDGFVVADDLSDADKRVAFPAGTTIQPGAYVQFQTDSDGWPGFALGGDEELGIWLSDGTLVASVDWDEGQSPEGQSYARVPDITGDFQTVDNPTPGAENGETAANPPEPATEATTATAPSTQSDGGTPAAEGVGDSLYPQLGNAGYDVLHYGIELDVDPAGNTISAVTTITALATQDMPAFNLDLSGLDVHDVTVDSIAAAFSRSGSELTVRPAIALVQGEEFSVSVAYSGSPEPIDDPGVPFSTLGWHSQDGVIYTVSEPSGAMTWFPSNNHPSDKATFELRITVPTSTTAAATGLLVDETTADGRTTTTWRMDDLMATYVAAVYIGDFERVEHGRLDPDGPLLRDYVPSDAPPEITEALAVTEDVIRFLEELLGPYPFDAYGTLVLPLPLDLALENQTLPVHGPRLLGPDIIAHEAAHQWLGNSVALEDWGDIWLNEGFATYLHMMFDAEYHGTDFDASMQQLHAQLPRIAATPPKGITIDELFGPSVYVRSAMTLHALRIHAGDETFFAILRAHYDRSAGGTTNTDEFLGIVDEFAGPEAVGLVESWLLDETVPDLPERSSQ